MIELDIQERWPEIEPRIVKRPADAARYATQLGFRWPDAESAMLGNGIQQHLLLSYINSCVKERWEEAETLLSGGCLLSYALTYVRGRAPAIEKKILDAAYKDGRWHNEVSTSDLVQYSFKVIGDRWPEFENLMDAFDVRRAFDCLMEYVEHYEFRWEKLESLLAEDFERASIISYSQRVLRGRRSLAFEKFFERHPEYSAAFKKYCDLVDWSRPDTGPINDFVAKRMKRWMKAGTI